MTLEDFLRAAAVLLSAAVVVVYFSARIRIPSLIGLILTGLLVGPYGLGVVDDPHQVEVFAEVGVVLLLFIIGLELDLSQLKSIRSLFLIGGGLQTVLTSVLAFLTALPFLPIRGAIFVVAPVALSSTAVVLKLYGERRELRTPQGRAVLGILLFQDFLIVPLIVLAPILSGTSDTSLVDVGARIAVSFAIVLAVVTVARVVMPWVLHQLGRARVRELFVLTGLATALTLAWFTYDLGLSLALGAFLAGLLVSESDYAHQLVTDMVPFRDVFASVFFISIGMLVDIPFALSNLGLLLFLAAAVVVLKTLAATLAVLATRFPLRVAVITALSLAQIGEFSFVLMEVGRAEGLLSEDVFQTLLAASVLTLVAAPALIHVAPTVGTRLAKLFPHGDSREETADDEALSGHVIVCGLGTGGRLLTGVLEEAHIPHVAVELNGRTVSRERKAGRHVVFGDVTRGHILEHVGIRSAEAIVFTISDTVAVRRAVRQARSLNPGIEIIVRAQAESELEVLREAGADDVVSEEFETAIEIFTRVLRRFHVPRNVIRAQTRVLRGEGYEMLRVPASDRGISQQVLDALEAGTTELYRVEAGSLAEGATLLSLDLRKRTGASVIAVVRGEHSFTNPAPDMQLEAGDCLVLVGGHAQIDESLALLSSDR